MRLWPESSVRRAYLISIMFWLVVALLGGLWIRDCGRDPRCMDELRMEMGLSR